MSDQPTRDVGTHDSKMARAWVDAALAQFRSIDDPVQQAYLAWAWLRGVRRLGDDDLCRKLDLRPPVIETAPRDVNLADAEHYMYMRFLAGSTGDPATLVMPPAYGANKAWQRLLGREEQLRTDQRFPALPPSIDSIRWGTAGAYDGLGQYLHSHGGKYGKVGAAVRENESLIKAQGAGYASQTYSSSK